MRRSLTDVQPALDSEGGKLDAFVNQLKNNAAVAMRTLQAKQGIQSMAFYLVVLKGPGENEGTEAVESTDNNRGCDYSFFLLFFSWIQRSKVSQHSQLHVLGNVYVH